MIKKPLTKALFLGVGGGIYVRVFLTAAMHHPGGGGSSFSGCIGSLWHQQSLRNQLSQLAPQGAFGNVVFHDFDAQAQDEFDD